MEREEEIGGRGVPWGNDAAAEVAGERGNAAARGGAREIGEREGEGAGGLGSKGEARGGTTTSEFRWRSKRMELGWCCRETREWVRESRVATRPNATASRGWTRTLLQVELHVVHLRRSHRALPTDLM